VVGASAVINNMLYAIGGANDSAALTVVEAYNPATDTWSTMAPMPIPSDSVNATVENNIIYVVGGYNTSSGRLATVQAYNPATNSWTVAAPLLVGKSESAIGLLGSTIVAAGGLANSGNTADNEGYDAVTNAWTSLAPVPAPWQNGCFGAIGGMLYLAGGQTSGQPSTATELYSLQSNSWTTGLAPMPNATLIPGSAVVGGALYCFGGSNNPNPLTGAIFDYVQIYQPKLQPPAISGVVSAGAFGGFDAAAPGSWIEIYGSGLAADTRGWTGSDFSGINAPTSLDQTLVTIGGADAFIDYISPGQVNAQVPSTVGTGPQPVIVKTAQSSTAPYTITVNPTQPGLLAPTSFNIGGVQYAVALFPDGITYVLPTGTISGIASRSAKPGDTITLYGVGFGPVVPNIPAGQIVGADNTLSGNLKLSIGGTTAALPYAGLAPSFVGLYQFDVVVPDVAASNTAPLTFTLDGVPGTQTLYIPVTN
jgi:uncharacterized protein (TIGR03437 family)